MAPAVDGVALEAASNQTAAEFALKALPDSLTPFKMRIERSASNLVYVVGNFNSSAGLKCGAHALQRRLNVGRANPPFREDSIRSHARIKYRREPFAVVILTVIAKNPSKLIDV